MKWWLKTSQICWKTQTPRNINSKTYTKKYYNQAFERTKNLESSKGEVTHHTQGIISKITSRFLDRNFGYQEVVRGYISFWNKETVNQESYVWQNYPSTVRTKERYFQISKNLRSSLTALQVKIESPWLKWKDTDSKAKPHERPSISVKVNGMGNTQATIKAATVITKICNSTFCFLHDLRNRSFFTKQSLV